MDTEDKLKDINISREEEKSIARYLGFMHTNINMIGDLNPERFRAASEIGWYIEKDENVRIIINDFVNIYSAMYKESKRASIRGNLDRTMYLVRGTSNEIVQKMGDTVPSFMSASYNENIAKTFTKYGDGALIHFRVNERVPFLNVEKYRDENSKDEEEIIIAPFCKITDKDLFREEEGFNHYSINVMPPVLKSFPKEQLDSLLEEVVSGFSQNVNDMNEYNRLSDEIEILTRRIERAEDIEESMYFADKKEKTFEKYYEISMKTNNFREKLQTLLEGLCKEKELEIDKSIEIFEENRKEELRKSLISKLSTKVAENPDKMKRLEEYVTKTYDGLLENEKMFFEASKKLGVNYTKLVSMTDTRQKIEDIQNNLRYIESKTEDVKISENISIEEILEVSKNIEPVLDGVSYGTEIIKECPDIVQMHKEQSDKELKRNLYLKVHSVIQNAKVQKYIKENEKLKSEKIGFFGKITKKDKLQEEKIKNMDLKIKLAQNEKPEEKQKYRVRESLSDLYACVLDEYDGDFNKAPDIKDLYMKIQSTYYMKENEGFSNEYIKQLAMNKIEKQNLPVPEDKKIGILKIFGNKKEQIKSLQAENYQLQQKIEESYKVTRKKDWIYKETDEPDALMTFQTRLRGVRKATLDLTKNRNDLDQTLEIW